MNDERDFRIEEVDSIESVNEMLYQLGMTDGLPVVPPTRSRVRPMLQGRNPEEVVAVVPPKMGVASVERIAINSVMAGCLPQYLPVVIAAVQAMVEDQFNLIGLETTTGSAAPLAIINGPAVKELEINCAGNALGQGRRANATIGRAIRLILINIGGSIPGILDMASLGQPGKYTFCFGENEERSPWEPLHVERGFRREVSTVTMVGAAGTVEVVDTTSRTADGVLTTMANSMTIAGTIGSAGVLGGGEPLVILTPEHAELMASQGLSKMDVKRALYEKARLPLSKLSPEMADRVVENRKRQGLEDLNGDVRVAFRPEDIMVVVAGGVGVKSVYIPTWGGGTTAVSKPIAI